MVSKRGKVIVISGPSGSGKGTVVQHLLEICPSLQLAVSATTRDIRPGELEGVNYYFKKREEFESLIRNNEVLEYTIYADEYYGTLKSEAERIVSSGGDLLLEIEVNGAAQIRKLMGSECVTIMLIAPSAAEQEKRLRGRDTEPESIVRSRLEKAKAEISQAASYDYVVVNENDRSMECAGNIMSIINSEPNSAQFKSENMADYIAEYFN